MTLLCNQTYLFVPTFEKKTNLFLEYPIAETTIDYYFCACLTTTSAMPYNPLTHMNRSEVNVAAKPTEVTPPLTPPTRAPSLTTQQHVAVVHRPNDNLGILSNKVHCKYLSLLASAL